MSLAGLLSPVFPMCNIPHSATQMEQAAKKKKKKSVRIEKGIMELQASLNGDF